MSFFSRIFKHQSETSVSSTSSSPATSTPVAAPSFTEKTYRITGISHYQAAFNAMRKERNPDYSLSKAAIIKKKLCGKTIYEYTFCPQSVCIVPEPDNPVDKNAIKVVADGATIGYIKAGSCAHLLKVIREGRICSIRYKISG